MLKLDFLFVIKILLYNMKDDNVSQPSLIETIFRHQNVLIETLVK